MEMPKGNGNGSTGSKMEMPALPFPSVFPTSPYLNCLGFTYPVPMSLVNSVRGQKAYLTSLPIVADLPGSIACRALRTASGVYLRQLIRCIANVRRFGVMAFATFWASCSGFQPSSSFRTLIGRRTCCWAPWEQGRAPSHWCWACYGLPTTSDGETTSTFSSKSAASASGMRWWFCLSATSRRACQLGSRSFPNALFGTRYCSALLPPPTSSCALGMR